METTKQENRVIVSFHIGRGGRFYNSGHKTYLGEKNFQDLIQSESGNLCIVNRDEQGKFIKPTILDDSGNVVSTDDINSLIGILDFDGDYDTSIAKYLENCTDDEIDLIRKSDEPKSEELIEYLKTRWVNE